MSLDLALYENANKWLTKPETALLQLFDKEVEKKKKIMQDKLKERLIIAEAISSHESKESEDRERKQSEKDAMAPPAKKKKEEPVRKDPEISNVQIMGIMEKIYQAEAAKTSPIESSIGSSSIGDVSSASPSTTEVGTAATTTTTAIIKKKRKLEEVEDDDNESTTPVEVYTTPITSPLYPLYIPFYTCPLYTPSILSILPFYNLHSTTLYYHQ